MHVILSPLQADEESSGWSRLLRFFVACRLLRMTANGEPLNLGLNNFSVASVFFVVHILHRYRVSVGHFPYWIVKWEVRWKRSIMRP